VKFEGQGACPHCMSHLLLKWRVLSELFTQFANVHYFLSQISLLLKVCDANARFASKFSDYFLIFHVQCLYCIHQITYSISRCRDDQGCTPLHIAAARNRGAVVNQLLKFGAGLMRYFCACSPGRLNFLYFYPQTAVCATIKACCPAMLPWPHEP
jgi:hypothetical protein